METAQWKPPVMQGLRSEQESLDRSYSNFGNVPVLPAPSLLILYRSIPHPPDTFVTSAFFFFSLSTQLFPPSNPGGCSLPRPFSSLPPASSATGSSKRTHEDQTRKRHRRRSKHRCRSCQTRKPRNEHDKEELIVGVTGHVRNGTNRTCVGMSRSLARRTIKNETNLP